jgi:integrase
MAKRLPAYRLHKPSGKAVVTLDGKDHYLGLYGSDESRRQYGILIANHNAAVPIVAAKEDPSQAGLMVKELCLTFLIHAEKHYVKDGKQTSEVHCVKAAIRPLVKLYGETRVNEFGPLMLKAVRAAFVELGWVRRCVNKSVGRIRHIFRYGVENELVEPATLQKLEAVAPLLAGRTEATDNPPRTAVPDEHIQAVKKLVRPFVADLIDLQRLIGARSGELLGLTTGMIDRSGPVWVARLQSHKTIHHGHSRTLAIGPKAQAILVKYLSDDPNKPILKMTRCAYNRAIVRACKTLKIPRWVPHQLRHTAAVTIRETFGLEHVQATLGHANADMAEHYGRLGIMKSVEVAAKIG